MEDILKIAICEDTSSDADKLIQLLNSSPYSIQCRLFTSAEAFLEIYRPQMFDLLLTDIYMGGITGIEAVSRIREIDENLPVAFITTSTDHTLESYRLSALKYIEKPFRQKDIDDIVKLAKLEQESAPSLVLMQNGKETRIRFCRILYAEQQMHQLKLILQGGEEAFVYAKLSALLPQFDGQGFFCPHKSYVVNLAFVREIDAELKCFVMQDSSNIPIRRESMSKAKKALADYLFHRTRGL